MFPWPSVRISSKLRLSIVTSPVFSTVIVYSIISLVPTISSPLSSEVYVLVGDGSYHDLSSLKVLGSELFGKSKIRLRPLRYVHK